MVIECFGFTLWTSQTTFIAITSSHSPIPLYKVGRTYTRWGGGINTWSLMTSVQDLALLCPAMPLNLLDLIFLICMIEILTSTVKRVRFSIVEHVCRSLYEDISRLYNLIYKFPMKLQLERRWPNGIIQGYHHQEYPSTSFNPKSSHIPDIYILIV